MKVGEKKRVERRKIEDRDIGRGERKRVRREVKGAEGRVEEGED